MLEINCNKCNAKCCQNEKLIPVLLPSEEKKFKNYSEIIITPYRKLKVLKRKQNKCIFLNNKINQCKIYKKKPFDCEIYPLSFKLKDKKTEIFIDKRVCSNLKKMNYNKKKLLSLIKKQQLDENWIKAYNLIDDF